jgi:hypothetical protein
LSDLDKVRFVSFVLDTPRSVWVESRIELLCEC